MTDPVEALRQATREAREALQDLKTEQREYRAAVARAEQTRDQVKGLIESIPDRVDQAIRVVVDREMDLLNRETKQAVTEARTRVFDYFNQIGEQILDQLGGESTLQVAITRLSGAKRSEFTSLPGGFVPPALKNRIKQDRIKL